MFNLKSLKLKIAGWLIRSAGECWIVEAPNQLPTISPTEPTPIPIQPPDTRWHGANEPGVAMDHYGLTITTPERITRRINFADIVTEGRLETILQAWDRNNQSIASQLREYDTRLNELTNSLSNAVAAQRPASAWQSQINEVIHTNRHRTVLLPRVEEDRPTREVQVNRRIREVMERPIQEAQPGPDTMLAADPIHGRPRETLGERLIGFGSADASENARTTIVTSGAPINAPADVDLDARASAIIMGETPRAPVSLDTIGRNLLNQIRARDTQAREAEAAETRPEGQNVPPPSERVDELLNRVAPIARTESGENRNLDPEL